MAKVLAGRYRLDEEIGEGATGVVWRATELATERPLAIKLMRQTSEPDARARFAREARVASAVRHPAIVEIRDFGEADGEMFIAMELLVGESLRAHLATHRPTVAEAAAITVDVAAALEAAHEINLVHRDIKPENIFLETRPGGRVTRVVDFGLAFITARPGTTANSLGRLTDEGILGGTPLYMSPEQARGAPIGPAADIYALGCVCYELIAGRPPFSGTVAQLLTRHVYTTPVPLRKLAPDLAIEPVVDELVARMLSKHPPMRPPPARVIEVLGPVAAGVPRGRSRSHALARADRMVPHGVDTVEELPPAAIPLAWVGPRDEELILALAANGFDAIETGTPDGERIVFAPGASATQLAALAARGRPVVTDVDASDLAAITAHLRAGVAEAVSRPVRSDDLARKLRRALRLARDPRA